MRSTRRSTKNKTASEQEEPSTNNMKVVNEAPTAVETSQPDPANEIAPQSIPTAVSSADLPAEETAVDEAGAEDIECDDSSQSSEPIVTIAPPTVANENSAWSVPRYSYFEVRSDRDKRLYVECFAEIIGRVKTNYHFRCKGCNESFLGQFLNMLVHMAGTNNHVRARMRACKKPIPEVRARILADFAAYNEREKQIWSQIKVEPGQSQPVAPPPIKRGRKRSLSTMLPSAYQHTATSVTAATAGMAGLGLYGRSPRKGQAPRGSGGALGGIPPGAAVYENCITSYGAGRAVTAAEVSAYYSDTLKSSADLQTSCCTTAGTPPLYLRQALGNVHDDVMAKYYGCGLVAPDLLPGLKVLDLGCGAGRDCYVLAQLVGEHGAVVGVDMSAAQLATARATEEWHRQRFGYARSNVRFVQRRLESLLSDEGEEPNAEGGSGGKGGVDSAPTAASGSAGGGEDKTQGRQEETRSEEMAGHTTAAAALSASQEEEEHTDAAADHAVAAVHIKEEPNYDDFELDGMDEEGADGDGSQHWPRELDQAFHMGEDSDFAVSGHDQAQQGHVRGLSQKGGGCDALAEGTFDVIVSNCVLNLCMDKGAVLDNAYALLKSGGELYFSDVYATQRVPQELRADPVLWGECLSGALYWNDFLRLARECGFGDPRLVTSAPIDVQNPELEERIARYMPSAKAGALFYSATYRLFKIPELEPDCEDYGQAVRYLGTIPHPSVPARRVAEVNSSSTVDTAGTAGRPLPLQTVALSAPAPSGGTPFLSPLRSPAATAGTGAALEGGDHRGASSNDHRGATANAPAPSLMSTFVLDSHHRFPAGMVVRVCGNTYRMLQQSRFRPHFEFYGGEFTQHYGIFEGCGKALPFATAGSNGGGCGASCC